MSWHETHRRWQLLREVEETIARHDDGQLPWREEYASVFGDPDGLRTALVHRIRVARQAQLDPDLSEEELVETHRELAQRHRAVLRVLRSSAQPSLGSTESLRASA
ncbi:hypothetical protein [Nocardioides daejeonensis]|uniref:hypothetical protein n=1 Tax=Nocardioides daejeonensis TaxID=1046556 RepID=UPI000D74A6C4|nr:hypothetical protein [Nocardioides daejeonensis]